MSLAAIFGDWRLYNDLMVNALQAMSGDELALRAPSGDESSSTSWPIWAIAGHTAGTRVYWLCHVAGLPGAGSTPFTDPTGVGWEDDLRHPRSASELVAAWRTTWAVVEGALAAWTPATVDEPVARGREGDARHFTRRSLIIRLITHEAYHAGEIAVVQGLHGRTPIDLWPAGYHSIAASERDARG